MRRLSQAKSGLKGNSTFHCLLQLKQIICLIYFLWFIRSSSEDEYFHPGMDLAAQPGVQGHLRLASNSPGLQIAFMDDSSEEQPSRLIFGVFDPRVDSVSYDSLYGYVSACNPLC